MYSLSLSLSLSPSPSPSPSHSLSLSLSLSLSIFLSSSHFLSISLALFSLSTFLCLSPLNFRLLSASFSHHHSFLFKSSSIVFSSVFHHPHAGQSQHASSSVQCMSGQLLVFPSNDAAVSLEPDPACPLAPWRAISQQLHQPAHYR